ncbi:aspartate-semialdehyde dehydrogenase [bacterium]|jgi:aspartate-semialdehyde dehydrogenase|nr:aspartate-semialdehyde dehydrogenase [bacterium]MBT3581533.1 aspartate-semialdehyde dehydrogenase [bacterium]MBT4551511.1 aspartate-semialdehyde dehydrogenase [bacterium]MBT7087519.1 aspartate-semialdehyde dehydrogenase [bacterium]
MSKISVGILGATGSVGQKFIELLQNHPDFEITALAASSRSAGKTYQDAVNWFMATPIPEHVRNMKVSTCEPNLDCKIVFSGLDASVAGEIETAFAKAGYIVVSNSRNHRFDADVPLIVPEINPEQLSLTKKQAYGKGCIITNPNCSTIGLVMALKPLLDNFGLESVNVVTLQALSGAGYPGISSLDIIDNVLPYIKNEEEKMETEPYKILGTKDFKISATCNRVAVIDGHTECVAVKLKNKARKEDIIKAWQEFRGKPQELNLPTAPLKPIHYFSEDNFPQPKLHRNLDKGMAVSIGRLRPCPILDYKFTILSHNTIRGAAGGAILNAELFINKIS